MPQVPSHSQVVRSGQKTRADMRKTSPASIPRDDLRTAFAGDQNKGQTGLGKRRKAGKKKSGTQVKSRRLAKDSGKTPVR